ncbi:MAG: thiamine phosphate synthase [Aestuariivirga sp.]
MDRGTGESRLIPRLFLVAPEHEATHLAACLAAACAAGGVASLLLPHGFAKELTPVAQKLGVAVLTIATPYTSADGVHVDASAVAEARQAIGKNGIVGAFAGTSRHLAMEAAEAGADYVALSQNAPAISGESIIEWWATIFQIPCVAFDPVTAVELDTLLPQMPDFIRPLDAMWEGPDASRRIVSELTQRLKK